MSYLLMRIVEIKVEIHKYMIKEIQECGRYMAVVHIWTRFRQVLAKVIDKMDFYSFICARFMAQKCLVRQEWECLYFRRIYLFRSVAVFVRNRIEYYSFSKKRMFHRQSVPLLLFDLLRINLRLFDSSTMINCTISRTS